MCIRDSVATRSDLEDFARQAATGTPDGHRLLTSWRGELVGRELLELWDGHIALASSPRPPHIVPVRLDDPHDAENGPGPAVDAVETGRLRHSTGSSRPDSDPLL